MIHYSGDRIRVTRGTHAGERGVIVSANQRKVRILLFNGERITLTKLRSAGRDSFVNISGEREAQNARGGR